MNKTKCLLALSISLVLSVSLGAISAGAGEPNIESDSEKLIRALGDQVIDSTSLYKLAPMYPQLAKEKGIEGFSIVEYTIGKDGSVRDVSIVESNPSGYFERAASKAAMTFKYTPRIVNGIPIPVHGVQNKFTFRLDFSGNMTDSVDESQYQSLIVSGPSTTEEVLVIAKGHIQKNKPQQATDLLVSHIARSNEDEPQLHRLLNKSIKSATWSQGKTPKNNRTRVIRDLSEQLLKEENGQTHIRLANLYISNEEWSLAFSHLIRGLEQGNVDQPDVAKISLGMSLYHLGNHNDAIEIFRQVLALNSSQSKKLAAEWLTYIEKETERKRIFGAIALRSVSL